MKDKVIFWLDQDFTYYGIANYLQKKADCDFFAIIDVTNKTNVAVQMGIADQAAGTYSNGSTSRTETGMVFLRIGDT